jgi:acyl-CoA thioester hydrolase
MSDNPSFQPESPLGKLSVYGSISVRYRDIDAFGHVNNAVYLSYLEQARIDYFAVMAGAAWNWDEFGVIVARNEIDYLRPIHLGNEVKICTWCAKLGRSSMKMAYQIFGKSSENGDWWLAAKAETVIVAYDLKLGKVMPVHAHWAERLV